MKVPFNKLKFLSVGISTLAIMAFTLNKMPQKTIAIPPPLDPTTTQQVIDAANAFKATLTAAQVTLAVEHSSRWLLGTSAGLVAD